jgi:L-histidine Nalpha-methyltransferase
MSAVLEVATRPLAAAAAAAAPSSARAHSAFAHDVLAGLAQAQKKIHGNWLHDLRGSERFEQITRLDEYDPTRTETWILERCAAQIAQAAGPGATVIELGGGAGRSRQMSILLGAFDVPASCVSIGIAQKARAELALALRAGSGRRVLFIPGPTIGNFTPEAVIALLRRIGQAAGPDALLIVGADATRDPAVLLPAYDDRLGATAAFNLNLLARINRELGGDFDLDGFRHEVRFDAAEQRVEMHLLSLCAQRVQVLGRSFRFAPGESIHTESAYQYGLVRFQALAQRAGWSHQQLWMDGQSRFAVHVLERAH